MGNVTLIKWALFAAYLSLFFTFPLWVLWDLPGYLTGAVLTVAAFLWMGWHGTERIAKRMKAKPLGQAQAPHVHAILREYCRRLRMPVPELRVIESRALNLAAFGFSRNRMCIVVTRGILDHLTRDRLSAILGRELTSLWYGSAVGESWLSQYLSLLETILLPPQRRRDNVGRHLYPMQVFLRQLLVWPLASIPLFLLRGKGDPSRLDSLSIRLTRRPEALAEALRVIETGHQRAPYHERMSVRHLFLVPPVPHDPLARLLFSGSHLEARINTVEALTQTVAVTG